MMALALAFPGPANLGTLVETFWDVVPFSETELVIVIWKIYCM